MKNDITMAGIFSTNRDVGSTTMGSVSNRAMAVSVYLRVSPTPDCQLPEPHLRCGVLWQQLHPAYLASIVCPQELDTQTTNSLSDQSRGQLCLLSDTQDGMLLQHLMLYCPP